MGNKSVCLNCHIAYNNGINFYNAKDIYPRVCPRCNQEMKDLTYRFRPPKKDADNKWETIRYLIEHGFYFQHVYDYENDKIAQYPQNLKDAKIFVEKYSDQRTRIYQIFDRVQKSPLPMSVEQEIDTIKALSQTTLYEILNEKQKFMTIIEKLKKSHINHKNDKRETTKKYNDFKKILNKKAAYFKPNKRENILEIFNSINA